MDFSASNTQLWNGVIQFGVLSLILLIGNALRRKVGFLRKSLLPTAIIAGFIALAVRLSGWFPLDKELMEMITYHTTGIGFIALSLRMPRKSEISSTASQKRDGFKSGMLIVNTYLLQGILGLAITAFLAYTFFPNLFKASGLLLPLGYGQGPGQANNIGTTYENTYGFTGGSAFGLAVATLGFLWACIGGVIYLLVLTRKGKVKRAGALGDSFPEGGEPVEEEGEIPLTEAVDKSTIQIALVLMVYLGTFAFSIGMGYLFDNVSALASLKGTVMPLIWGFNFLIGSILALVVKWFFSVLKKSGLMKRQYTNNYLLNRISGIAFDLMIVCSVCSIDLSDLKELWIPFTVLTTVGGFVTLAYLHYVCKRLYPNYEREGMLSMYGMLTGTVSTGIVLLREVDPDFKTPAANNLVIGSSSAILLGFPFLLLLGIAPKSDALLFVTIGIMAVYFIVLNFLMLKKSKKVL